MIEACKWCKREGSAGPGERSFRVCCALIGQGALEDEGARTGALAFLKPWCSSLVATQCLGQIDRFNELSRLCKDRNDGFYKVVDTKVTIPALERAARIAANAPTGTVRQDDAGVVPPLKFYRDLACRASISFDHEAGVAHAYAFLGLGLESMFERDVQRMFRGSGARVVTVAPKSFQRMQNKLLNPAEHGDPAIARPRCARSLDVLRGCVIVRTVQELEAAYDKLAAAAKVVRVKNTHEYVLHAPLEELLH